MATNKPQFLKEWAMAGGGVPLQYKDRPIDWHRKVAAFAAGGEVHMEGGGAAFYPRVGNIKAKNFKPAKPMPIMDDPRAMEFPQDIDLSIPTRENLEMSRRMAQREADLKRQQEGDRSPLEKLAGGVQAGRFLGSALTQGINAMPTRIAKGDEAADKFLQERLYKPEQPTAYEYAGDVGDFLEKLETEYKIPPLLPEAVALQYLTGPAASQAKQAAGRGAQALEKRLDPLVTQTLERGGLQRDLLLGLGQGAQANVIKPKGGNWLNSGSVERMLDPLKRRMMRAAEQNFDPTQGMTFGEIRAQDALDNWVDRNLTNYIKKEMGTAEDPVRKLAEEGIVHISPEQVGRNRYKAPDVRRQAGTEQLGQSEAAKAWEDAADVAITPLEIKNLSRDYREPWMEKADPSTNIYEPTSSMDFRDLGFDHIMDVLREDLAAGRIRPEQMNKISITDAVRRTAQYDQELAKKMNESRAAARADLPVYKDYPEGYRWVELNKPGSFAAESEAMGHSVRGYEPPKGHPDWVEGSGNSGSSGYGHGGWEAIKSGKAKVYSLVDSKGAPHATVEVKTKGVLTDDDFGANDARIVEGRGDFGERGYRTTDNQFFETYADAVSHEKAIQKPTPKELEEPPSITQIKGKQNRAPNAEYLPYVQDFVRGGKWSDVGDIQNTGLSNVGGRYFTEPELVEAAKKYGRMGVQDTPWEVARQRHIDAGVPEEQALENWVEGFREGRGRLDIPPEGMANGGEVHMQTGGLAKILKGAIKAPDIIVPSRMTELKDLIRKSEGEYAAKRLERAADEIPNLERMYKLDALKQAFTGDNAKAVATMHPADFERYAVPLEKKTSVGPKAAELAKKGDIDKYTVTTDEYLKHLQRIKGGFDDAAFLSLVKQEAGLPLMPYIRGHEGRHRSRALADQGETKSLVRILPGGDLREGLPRRSQEEFIDALRQEMEQTGKLVLPEKYFDEKAGAIQRPAIELPDLYAKGGEVHMGGGGALKAALAKLGKFATEADVAAIKEAGRATHEQEAFIRAAKNADVEKRLQSMPPRSKSANMEMGMYHPVGGGLKLTKPFEALHSTRVPNPKVNKPNVKILTPEDIYRERAGLFPLVGDKADTGTFLTHIGEKELEIPVGLGGGPRYMDANYNIMSPSESAAWESGTGRTTFLGNQAQRIAERDRPAFGVYIAGSGTNTDFNIMGANAVLQQLGQSKLTKKAEKAFDKAMREEGTEAFPPMPNWPGIRSPQLEDMLLDKSNGILRTKLFDTMGKENFQSMGFPDVPATRKAIMDPQLYDVPTHESGFRIARMDPTGRIVEDPLHPSDYPTAMAGELEGQLNTGVDYKDMFSTHFANRRLLSQPESGDYRSFSRAFPIQYADQEWLDKIMKAQEAKDKLIKTGKYAEGGEVHMQVGGLSKVIKAAVKKAPQEEALKLAQQRAALSKEMGGLGLPIKNTAEQRAEAMGAIDYMHGTERLDRFLEAKNINPKRATSGPMPFGTDSGELASNYAMNKADTSRIANDMGDMQNYFQVFPKSMGERGTAPYSVEQLWYRLPQEKKAEILEKSKRVGFQNFDESSGPLTLHPEGVNAMNVGEDTWNYFLNRESKGNPLIALRKLWGESGNLYGNEDKLADVYKLAGFPYEISQTNAPWTSAKGVFTGKAMISNPLDTSNVSELQETVIPFLKEQFKNDRTRTKEYGADQWDKNSRYTPKEWVANLEKDISAGENSFVWTSIPDKITNSLKGIGYNGILDKSGKGGGNISDVVIPFSPEQVRSRFAAFDPFRKTAATAAAMGVAAPDLLAEEKTKSRGGLSSIK